jgi:hypothetical protein
MSAVMRREPRRAAINTKAGVICSGWAAPSMGVSAVNFVTVLAGRLLGLSSVKSGPGAIAFTLILPLRGLRGTTAQATQIKPNRRAIEGPVTGVEVADAILERCVNGEVDLARALDTRGLIDRDPFEVRLWVRLIEVLGGKAMPARRHGARALPGALALLFVNLGVEVGRVSLTLPDGGILPVPAAVMLGGSRFTRAHSCPSDFSLGKKRLRDHRFGCARGGLRTATELKHLTLDGCRGSIRLIPHAGGW